ncbi:Alpha/Beta hydrolase protein [Podospora appendiculata]|uniref:Alpha/Beta hydrolase protein n=1 Tax=Podospora appendiculata TaxID=314037 RepID=A0AAE0XK71_9PEZI|nr:Alpha/Beta hydrolase protein [Podospora appendiculata]
MAGCCSLVALILVTAWRRPLSSNNGDDTPAAGVSVPFFASLERMARLVDITYCVGTTGVSPPFSCASRCKDFPSLDLVRTWNTGVLLSDSCGFIAVDHGSSSQHHQQQHTPPPSKPAIIVAFRGTYSITNTIIDLSTVPQEYVPYPSPDDDNDDDTPTKKCANCTVHMGFLASWRSARELVLPALKTARAKHPGYPVHLVGHSLGGAVAALAALELRVSLGWRDVTVTTFGEPRIGNKHLARYLNEAFDLLPTANNHTTPPNETLRYRRVTHANDPVPLLPLSEWGFRAHAGEVYIGKADLPPAPEDLRLCRGADDPECSGGPEADGWLGWVLGDLVRGEETRKSVEVWTRQLGGFPARLKLWQLFFAHRDYFWRLGLCVPGGDPVDWGREKYRVSWAGDDEL